ncbi:MAG: RNA polymerase sigma factor [Phycisphaerae bacterium]|nr:RNA polymerase sigma factor [Phycisphaerae bacterium]
MTGVPMRIPRTLPKPAAGDDEYLLIERAANDREAFATLYRQHYPLLCNHVYRRTGDRHATEDLVSEVFLAALRALPRYRYRGVPLKFWLLRIATNLVNRWARRRVRLATVPLPANQVGDPGPAPASKSGEHDVEHARDALLKLSPQHQAALALHYFEGLAVKDVAIVMGCRVGTVKSRLARARDALRDALNERR